MATCMPTTSLDVLLYHNLQSHRASTCHPHVATEGSRNLPSNWFNHIVSEGGPWHIGVDCSSANRLDVVCEGSHRGRSRLVYPLAKKSKFVGICGGGSDLTLGEANCGCGLVPSTSCQFKSRSISTTRIPSVSAPIEGLLEQGPTSTALCVKNSP